MRYVPLHMIDDNGRFRLKDKKAIYIKVNNLSTLDVQMYSSDGKAYVETKSACLCKTLAGKILTLDPFIFVQQV
jgi:hypothetical protein